MIVALLPAHNEAGGISASVHALLHQTHPVDQVIVVADNCTDDTELLAIAAGASIFVTIDNADKKAGALNQALASVLLTLSSDDLVLIADADSRLAPAFVAQALEALADPAVGAVGGVFTGEQRPGLLPALQRMEYARYARDLDRSGKVWVLTGTATLHRVPVLREVAKRRGADLPGRSGDVYDRSALTEDMEITLAIKSLGFTMASPAACIVETELMPTLKSLLHQRLRWQRGALENLRTYGVSRVTAPYLRQQALMALGLIAMTLYLTQTVLVTVTGGMTFSPFWTAVGIIFITERVVTVWSLSWRHRVLALFMVFDWAYDLFLQFVILRAAFDAALRRPELWHHESRKEVTS